jgi:hypothetical protein
MIFISHRPVYTLSFRLARQNLMGHFPAPSPHSTLLAHTYLFAGSWKSSSIRLLNFVAIVKQSFFKKQL